MEPSAIPRWCKHPGFQPDGIRGRKTPWKRISLLARADQFCGSSSQSIKRKISLAVIFVLLLLM